MLTYLEPTLYILIWYTLFGLIVGLIFFIVRFLTLIIQSKKARAEKSDIKKSLGETLKAHRTRCNMTQEFVAEAVGVSRQAVSKWETGVSRS